MWDASIDVHSVKEIRTRTTTYLGVGAIARIADIAAVLKQRDEVERDAARFRWLMERNFGFAFDAERCGIATGRWGRWPEEPDEQRAMIDRAIAYYAAKAAAERAERAKGGSDA